MFGLDRRWGYAAVVLGYYFFVFVFSYRVVGFQDYFGAATIGVTSYIWFLFMSSTRGGFMLLDRKDLIIVLTIYYFIAFFVMFVDWQTSGWFKTTFSWIKIAMSIASIMMWTGIWVDFYFQRTKGNL